MAVNIESGGDGAGMTTDSGPELPAGLAAAWGVRERPGKGPKPGLSLERIVAAAVHVAAADGYAAVSMNRIAKELGASAMALYRYIDAKDELIPLMLDAAIGDPPEPRADDEAWRPAVHRWCRAYLEALRRHPWTLRVQITSPPATPRQVAWFDHGLAALRGTDLTEGEKVSVIMLLSNYVRSTEAMFHSIAEAVSAAGSSTDQLMYSYSGMLRRLIDPAAFPSVHAALDQGVFDQADSSDSEFEFGLDRFLDGIEVLMRSRG